ncbi:hypothetical protein GOP47_0015728 [Adiantum capillus-veneris]|uniref:NPH3 domain-containing protein n=1 Tax=Adiantum capillus-veneris TaxID=13818 RepID=A0A9D4ZCW4_ADICA|nr:hypothetical protein GOP47_0015728 [Adiantum capillus-veneris]
MARLGKAQAGTFIQKSLAVIDAADTRAYHGSFVRRGQSWFCATGLPNNIVVEVDEMLFHLHKFPLITRSGKISKMVADASSSDDEADNHSARVYQKPPHGMCHIHLHGIPGGADTFELVAKFCYGVNVELTASNVAAMRCAGEYLDMTEEYGEQNLICLTESFLNNIVIRSWKHSVKTLKSCESLLPLAEELSLVKRCVEAIATKVCSEPSLYGWPAMDQRRTLQSPSGKLLWSDSRRGNRRTKDSRVDWWYEDVSLLNLPLFKCVLQSMEDKGLAPEAIAGALVYYTRKSIPGMHRRQGGSNGLLASTHLISSSNAEQLFCLETIESLLPSDKGLVPTVFLSSLLKVSMILNAEKGCIENLEKRVGAQLDQATVDDILIPNYSEISETLYDVECVERIVQHFVNSTKALVLRGQALESDVSRSSSSFPLVAVTKLMDAYLVEIASDVNLLPGKFRAVLESLPHDARVLDDGMYQAIDIYLKAHPWVEDLEREALCSLISCEKLTQAACVHAAQNTKLPLKIVAQVLFLEQAQLRAAFTGVLEAATVRTSPAESQLTFENPTLTAMPRMGKMLEAWPVVTEENSIQTNISRIDLRADMTTLRHRIEELEQECTELRQHLQRKPVRWSSLSKLSCRSLSNSQLPVSSTNPRRQRASSCVSLTPRVVEPPPPL